MITYKEKNKTSVYLEKKYIGDIFEINTYGLNTRYQYFPKGKKEGGEKFKSLALCKKSL